MEKRSMSNNRSRHRINITPENKIQFWTIFTTALVGLFSLWIGITIQDDINTKNGSFIFFFFFFFLEICIMMS